VDMPKLPVYHRDPQHGLPPRDGGILMKRTCRLSVLAYACVLAFASQSFAQGKIKVAIWEFDNNAAHTYWYWDKLGPAARNIIDTAFSENKLLSAKFSVIDRDKLNLV